MSLSQAREAQEISESGLTHRDLILNLVPDVRTQLKSKAKLVRANGLSRSLEVVSSKKLGVHHEYSLKLLSL